MENERGALSCPNNLSITSSRGFATFCFEYKLQAAALCWETIVAIRLWACMKVEVGSALHLVASTKSGDKCIDCREALREALHACEYTLCLERAEARKKANSKVKFLCWYTYTCKNVKFSINLQFMIRGSTSSLRLNSSSAEVDGHSSSRSYSVS